MKKIYGVLALLFIGIQVSNAQITQKGMSTVQIGYGFPSAMGFIGSIFKLSVNTNDASATADFRYKGIGPFHFRYDYMLGGRVGLGLSANAEFGNFKFTADYEDNDGVQVHSVTNFDYSSINAMLRMNVHFIKEPKKVDVYWGCGVGYAHSRVKLRMDMTGKDIDPLDQEYIDDFNKYMNSIFKYLPVAIEEVVGLKVPLNNNAGVYFEVGYSKALAQIGFYAKLGSPKGYNSDNWKWY